jgi:hypothetical protein
MSQATTCRGNLVATCMQHKFAATGETYVYCACLLDRSVMVCVCTVLLTCCDSCRIRCIARRSLVGPCRGEVDLAVGELSVSGGSGGTGQCRCRIWTKSWARFYNLEKLSISLLRFFCTCILHHVTAYLIDIIFFAFAPAFRLIMVEAQSFSGLSSGHWIPKSYERGEFIQFLYRNFRSHMVSLLGLGLFPLYLWAYPDVSMYLVWGLDMLCLRCVQGGESAGCCVALLPGTAGQPSDLLGLVEGFEAVSKAVSHFQTRLWRGVSVSSLAVFPMRTFLGRKTSDKRHERMEKVLKRMFWHIETIRPSLRRMPTTRISQIARPFLLILKWFQTIVNLCKLIALSELFWFRQFQVAFFELHEAGIESATNGFGGLWGLVQLCLNFSCFCKFAISPFLQWKKLLPQIVVLKGFLG